MNILFYITNFILAVICILFGIVFLVLPWSFEVRSTITEFINENFLLICIFGSGLVFIGTGVITYLLLNARKRSFCLRSGRCSIKIDDKIFHRYLQEYLNDLFPNQESSYHLILRKNKILVSLDIPYMPKIEQESITEKILEDIAEILSQKIGYSDELKLTVFFQPPNLDQI